MTTMTKGGNNFSFIIHVVYNFAILQSFVVIYVQSTQVAIFVMAVQYISTVLILSSINYQCY